MKTVGTHIGICTKGYILSSQEQKKIYNIAQQIENEKANENEKNPRGLMRETLTSMSTSETGEVQLTPGSYCCSEGSAANTLLSSCL